MTITDRDLAIRFTGVTYRQLDYWTRKGWLRPDAHSGVGSGNPRDWSYTEMRVARLIGQLTRAGIRVDIAATIARTAIENDQRRLEIAPGVTIEIAAA